MSTLSAAVPALLLMVASVPAACGDGGKAPARDGSGNSGRVADDRPSVGADPSRTTTGAADRGAFRSRLAPRAQERALSGSGDPPAGAGQVRSRQGRIIYAGKARAPREYSAWNAFDQDTESFLYVSDSADRVLVAGADGVVADFACELPGAVCGGAHSNTLHMNARLVTFGPDRDEVTVPVWDGEDRLRSLQVIGFDGRTREKLDISMIVRRSSGRDPGPQVTDIAWSPDGGRLAVSTSVDAGAIGRYARKLAYRDPRVWILNRRGGAPRLVYTRGKRSGDGTSDIFELRDLAWAPDGRRLGLVEALVHAGNTSREPPRPRLLVLHLRPGQPVRKDAFEGFDRPKRVRFFGFVQPPLHFAWSPDGTRIAVTSRRRITEISAKDRRVLARHDQKVLGPLAWVRGR